MFAIVNAPLKQLDTPCTVLIMLFPFPIKCKTIHTNVSRALLVFLMTPGYSITTNSEKGCFAGPGNIFLQAIKLLVRPV